MSPGQVSWSTVVPPVIRYAPGGVAAGRLIGRRALRYQLGLWGLSCGLLASACSLEDVDSDSIRTQGMFADMLALAPGDGTTIARARLTVGGEGGTSILLAGDDRLDALYADVSVPLRRSGNGRYEAELAGDLPGPIAIELGRGPGDAPAGGGAELPEPFVIELTTDDRVGIDRGSEVALTWSPALGGVMRWSVEGRCIWSASGETPDDGSLVLGPESFRVLTTRAAEDCQVDLTFERENLGTVDGVWIPRSRFRAIQRRVLRFVSTPVPEPSG